MPHLVSHFEDFELDPNGFCLSRSGEAVHLERIPLELLCLLVERCGQTVIRDEILERIWGKSVFIDSEHAINTAVRKIRRALNDDANAPRFIVTIPGKGYRFVAPVVVRNDEPKKNEPTEQADNVESAEFSRSQAAAADRQSAETQSDFVAPLSVRDSGERRHLTVLFCDLVNSTGLSTDLDPEEWREILVSYQRHAANEIERFGGHVAHYLGDGVIAYFGWPAARDDDVERAVRAGLAILDAISKFETAPCHSKLAARVGIDSGVVVIGDGTGIGADVYGEAPNMAARVQSAADSGTLLITETVHRLISGLFVVEERGPQQLKGIAQPVELYRVIRPSGVRGRLAAESARGLTPFIGREEELRLLMNRWRRAIDGEGQVSLIVGEPGIGKSRLVQRFHQQIADQSHVWLASGAVPIFQNTPFYAANHMLQQSFQLESEDSAEQKLAGLEASLASAGVNREAVPLVARLLELPIEGRYPPSLLPPDQQRKRLLAALVACVFAAARTQPLVIVTEDLHWADPSTLELIRLLVEQAATARVLLLYTARPEFSPSWPLRAHHTQIMLNRLDGHDAREMIGKVAPPNVLAAQTIDTLIERTSGVPLFIEELTRAVLENGNAKLGEREIPVTLHDSLMARMDRLGAAKEVLQIGAVMGRKFTYELLQAVCMHGNEELQQALNALADAEMLYVRGVAPDAIYEFKHALIRDAAYDIMLKSRRKDLHRLIAETINQKFPALSASEPEILAHHWTEAGETEQAIIAWSRVGKAAEAGNAFVEASQSFQKALDLIKLLPESRERDSRELKLTPSLVSMLSLSLGHGAPETVEAAERFANLAEKTGDLIGAVGSITTRTFQALVTGDLPAATLLASKGLKLAVRAGNPNWLAALRLLQMIVPFYRGDLTCAEKHFRAGVSFFRDPTVRQHPSGFSNQFLAWGSLNAWLLGRSNTARERLDEMRAVLNPTNPHDLAYADFFAANFYTLMRENETAEIL
ncbi:MAG TPA: AAA family ATPase, partial [Candidatus Binataceae bacterium]|nr:AAA family ATPase [Candidatus Binataceae bacterium]